MKIEFQFFPRPSLRTSWSLSTVDPRLRTAVLRWNECSGKASTYSSGMQVFTILISEDAWAITWSRNISLALNRPEYEAFKGTLTLDRSLRYDGVEMAIGLAYDTTQPFVANDLAHWRRHDNKTFTTGRYDAMATRYVVSPTPQS